MNQRQRLADSTISMDALRSALKNQYHATLAMLRTAIQRCPDNMWTDTDGHANPFWRIAYHTLYYTHLYLQPNEQVFRPWEHDQPGIHRFSKPLGEGGRRPYTKGEILAYWTICDSILDEAVDALDLNAPESGFSWYTDCPKLEHQIVNIRHIAYHQAQLGDRLRRVTGVGIEWEG